MKRFVTYLYEYKNKSRWKNVGFARVSVDKGKISIQLFLQNSKHENEMGEVYLLINKKELEGVELGKIDGSRLYEDSIFTMETLDAVGLAIRWEGGAYAAGCWNESFEGLIANGDFEKNHDEVQNIEEVLTIESKKEFIEERIEVKCESESCVEKNAVLYEKIDLARIRTLPCPNWYLSTNSFLLHGFWNYGYLVLKKTVEENQETLSLGVPGVFEKPEALMAAYFGFPEFEESTKKKENQEPKVGAFGFWFVKLKK